MKGGAVRRLLDTGDELRLKGWVQGEGAPMLMLHGGPGLSFDYLDGLAEELTPRGALASYQQRGLAPSRLQGPFTVADHCEDACRVLDELGWDRAVVIGHSWGGHLALHLAVAAPERVAGVLAVDPLGGVGDGGSQRFEGEIFRRTPEDVRERAQALDEMAMRGEGLEADAVESLRLMWPAYFPSWDTAPLMPSIRLSVSGYAETWASVLDELPRLEAALPGIEVPVGFVVGAASPMPATASTDTAGRIPGAWVDVVPAAGHFPWLDAPGCVRAGLERLTG